MIAKEFQDLVNSLIVKQTDLTDSLLSYQKQNEILLNHLLKKNDSDVYEKITCIGNTDSEGNYFDPTQNKFLSLGLCKGFNFHGYYNSNFASNDNDLDTITFFLNDCVVAELPFSYFLLPYYNSGSAQVCYFNSEKLRIKFDKIYIKNFNFYSQRIFMYFFQ